MHTWQRIFHFFLLFNMWGKINKNNPTSTDRPSLILTLTHFNRTANTTNHLILKQSPSSLLQPSQGPDLFPFFLQLTFDMKSRTWRISNTHTCLGMSDMTLAYLLATLTLTRTRKHTILLISIWYLVIRLWLKKHEIFVNWISIPPFLR